MPSLQDVADQINARLDNISTHTQNTAQNTADNLAISTEIRDKLNQTNNHLSQINLTLNTGFANLSQGLNVLIQLEVISLQLLDHHRKQNDTIICELVNSNNLLCNIMNKLGTQLTLSKQTLESTKRIEGINERVNCCEASDYDRDLEQRKRIEACCPPKPPRAEECPKPCDIPKYKARKPSDVSWKPLPDPKTNPEG